MLDTPLPPHPKPRIVCTPPMSRADLDALLAMPQGCTVSGKRLLAISDAVRPVIGQDEHGRVFATFFATLEDEDASERAWDALVSSPHVRDGLRRLAAEARREYDAGETEEGL